MMAVFFALAHSLAEPETWPYCRSGITSLKKYLFGAFKYPLAMIGAAISAQILGTLCALAIGWPLFGWISGLTT